METVFVSCPFCVKLNIACRERLTKGYHFQCSECHNIWSEPTRTTNLNKHGDNGYIKPRRK